MKEAVDVLNTGKQSFSVEESTSPFGKGILAMFRRYVSLVVLHSTESFKFTAQREICLSVTLKCIHVCKSANDTTQRRQNKQASSFSHLIYHGMSSADTRLSSTHCGPHHAGRVLDFPKCCINGREGAGSHRLCLTRGGRRGLAQLTAWRVTSLVERWYTGHGGRWGLLIDGRADSKRE